MHLPAVLQRIDADFPQTVDQLKQLVRIPSCSFPGFDPVHVEHSASATANWLRSSGYPQVELLRLPGVAPAVVAYDHRAGPDRPTVLLYAHHDVQPPLRESLWQSPPHEPVERGGRLYGRGAADDKAGIACHAAAAAAWNAVAGHPPINLTVVVEGEEEVGSPHFAEFLHHFRDRLRADVAVIADLANVDTGLPSLTTSLRGHVAFELELVALRSPLHSGMWGGPVPDVVMALSKLLASLTDDDGRPIVALRQGVRAPSAAELAAFARIPFAADRFADQAGLVRPGGVIGDAVTTHRALWREPAVAVHAVEAGRRGQTGNVLMDRAWARFGIRIVPDQSADQVAGAVEQHLRQRCPPWAALTLTPSSRGEAWATATDHPAFAAARWALAQGFGVAPIEIGCGASIPFVGEMTAALGGVPALLLGVEDPACAAHAENESVHLDDLRKAIRAEAALLAALAEGMR